MKNGIKITIGFVVIFLLLSCNQRRQVHIEGEVLNPITKEGIEGVELWLLKPGPITEYYGSYERVTTVFTDANGYFKIDVKSASAEILRVGNMHGEYYKVGWYQNGTNLPSDLPVQQGENMTADFYAVPYGKLNLNIKNVNCGGISDTMRLRNKWEFDEGGYGSWSPLYYTGCYQNVTGSSKVPIGEYMYQIKVHRINGDTIMEVSGVVHEGQLTTFEIHY